MMHVYLRMSPCLIMMSPRKLVLQLVIRVVTLSLLLTLLVMVGWGDVSRLWTE